MEFIVVGFNERADVVRLSFPAEQESEAWDKYFNLKANNWTVNLYERQLA